LPVIKNSFILSRLFVKASNAENFVSIALSEHGQKNFIGFKDNSAAVTPEGGRKVKFADVAEGNSVFFLIRFYCRSLDTNVLYYSYKYCL
jgi:hypothetical protein